MPAGFRRVLVAIDASPLSLAAQEAPAGGRTGGGVVGWRRVRRPRPGGGGGAGRAGPDHRPAGAPRRSNGAAAALAALPAEAVLVAAAPLSPDEVPCSLVVVR